MIFTFMLRISLNFFIFLQSHSQLFQNNSTLPDSKRRPYLIKMPTNTFHEWLKKRDWPKVEGVMLDPTVDVDLIERSFKEVDEHGRLPHHWFAEKAQTHTHELAGVGVRSICCNREALATRDDKGETPIDIALRSGACAPIIGLLSLTPESADSLGWKGMQRLFAPVAYWRDEMVKWIKSRSYADCHKFIDDHDDELVRELLKHRDSALLRCVAGNSKAYTESLVFLVLRMIHRNPLSLTVTDQNHTALQYAEHPEFNACLEIKNVLRLTPEDISSTPFPTLLRLHLPKQYVDEEIFGTYNTVCTFIKHMKYDKAELVELDADRTCAVCNLAAPLRCSRCKSSFYCSVAHQIASWKQHKRACKGLEAARDLHKGIALLNMCIQRPGAGDGPCSVVLDFLRPVLAPNPCWHKKIKN